MKTGKTTLEIKKKRKKELGIESLSLDPSVFLCVQGEASRYVTGFMSVCLTD